MATYTFNVTQSISASDVKASKSGKDTDQIVTVTQNIVIALSLGVSVSQSVGVKQFCSMFKLPHIEPNVLEQGSDFTLT